MHRIGRTARAGADGVAISFCDGEERAFLRDIEKLIRMSIASTDRRSDTSLELTASAPHSNGQRRNGHSGHNPKQQQRRHQSSQKHPQRAPHPHQGRKADHHQARNAPQRGDAPHRDGQRNGQQQRNAPNRQSRRRAARQQRRQHAIWLRSCSRSSTITINPASPAAPAAFAALEPMEARAGDVAKLAPK